MCIQAWLQSQGLIEINRATVTSIWQPHDMAFSTQQTFFELRHKHPLRLDFWLLPSVKPWCLSTGVGIECDFHSSHQNDLATDLAKNLFFLQHSIPLIRIGPDHVKDPVKFLQGELARLQEEKQPISLIPGVEMSEMIEYDPRVELGCCICQWCGRPSQLSCCTNVVCLGKNNAEKSSENYYQKKFQKLSAAAQGGTVESVFPKKKRTNENEVVNPSKDKLCLPTFEPSPEKQEASQVAFLAEFLETDVLPFTPVDDQRPPRQFYKHLVYEGYKQFCQQHGFTILGSTLFFRDVKGLIPGVFIHRPRVKDVRSWVVQFPSRSVAQMQFSQSLEDYAASI